MRHRMIFALSSRNPFAEPMLPTFADLIDRIAGDTVLPLRQRRNWMWALRVIARAAGKAQDANSRSPGIPAPDLYKIGAGLARHHQSCVEQRSFLSLEKRWSGQGLPRCPHIIRPLLPRNGPICGKCSQPGRTRCGCRLSRLLHFCSAQGIHPGQVNDEVLAVFHDALITEKASSNGPI